MAIRTEGISLNTSIARQTRKFTRRHGLLTTGIIIAALLLQSTAIARISIPSDRINSSSNSVLSEAGSVLRDLNARPSIVRVTDLRDGQARLLSRVNSTSFNLDSSRFFVNLDGIATLYIFDTASFAIQKRGQLFSSIALQADSLQWSAVERNTIIGLETGSARLYAYNTETGNYTLIKDFSDVFSNAEAKSLSKSWQDDNRFALSLGERGSETRFAAAWERDSDTIHLFDVENQNGGANYKEAHLDRSGDALIINSDVTTVWRYKTQMQFEAVTLDRQIAASSTEDRSFDLTSIDRNEDAPRTDVSRDGRFSIFSSASGSGRTDVYIAAVSAAVTASSINWTNLVNCTASANSVQKTGGNGNIDDARATSEQAALEGDTYVEFTAVQSDKERWCGLSNTNAIHESANDINFGIRLTNGKKAMVVESGTVKGKIKYKPGNTFRIAVESGVVNYYKNGSVFYTSSTAPEYPLLVNASLIDHMSAVEDVVIAGAKFGVVISVSPAKMNLIQGGTVQMVAQITGGIESVVWSATGGSITSTGFYTAPASNGTYTVRAACASHPNIVATATIYVSGGGDTTPPRITAVGSSNIGANAATVTWATDEASDTQLDYGVTTAYGSSSPLNPSQATTHSVALSGLNSSTLYHYRVKSRDAAGNLAQSGDFTFTTAAGADTTAPLISSVSSTGVTTSGATITWTTNEASDTQVEFGLTSAYGSSSSLSSSMVTSHNVSLSSLVAGSVYHYRVKSKDASSNLATSGDFTFTTSTATPPPSTPPGVVTDHNVYPEPATPALPQAGGTFVDPTFGTTIMRVTDENDGTSNFNYYSYWPTFNLDSTRFFIACDGNPKLYRFDPTNFRIVSKGPLFDQTLPGGGFISTEDAEWSGTNPNLLYGYNGLKLWSYDVSSRTYTLVKDFAGEIPAGYLGQMSRSLDDNVFAFTKKDANYGVTGYLVWQRDQNRILRAVSLGDFDEVQVDKSGRYLCVKAEFGGGVDFQVVDLQTGNVQNLSDPAPDFSPGHSDNGSQIVVGHDNWNNQYTVRSLASPHQFQRVISFGNDWSQANHLSMLADNEGWCVISNFTAGSGPVGPFRQEIFQASTDGSQSVRRLAHHHSVYRDYWDTPRADISRDGRFVAFTSNWGSTTRRDVFIIKVPQGGSGTGGGGDTTPPVISGVGASSPTSSGAVINWTTNEASDTQVEYGTTSSYGSASPINTSMTTSHSVSLSGLAASSTYHYRVKSKDSAGNLAVSGDYTFATAAGTGGGGGAIQNIVWTNVANCTVSGNSLQKTEGRDDESDAGALSQQQLVSGDGYLEFTAGVANKMRFCGLTHNASGTAYAAIDFAIKLTEFGVAEVRENNAYKIDVPYTGSDLFRISIEGGVVKYYKNGAVFYTSTGTPAYPLRADVAMLNLGSTINNAVMKAVSGVLATSVVEEPARSVVERLWLRREDRVRPGDVCPIES